VESGIVTRLAGVRTQKIGILVPYTVATKASTELKQEAKSEV